MPSFRSLPLRSAVLTAGLLGLAVGAASAQRQRPPRWTVGLETGLHLPSTMYNEWIRGILTVDDFDITTRYSERTAPAPLARAVVRYRPESGMGFFGAVQRMSTATTAFFHGGGAPPDTIARQVEVWIFEAGTSLRLGSFGGGGVVEYTLAPAWIHHSLDLTLGHRNVLAELGGVSRHDLEWEPRTWGSLAFSLSASVRFPLSGDLALRLTGQEYVVPVDKAELQEKERAAVYQLTGRAPLFDYNPYTAHYPSVRLGLEYTLRREPPPPPPPLVRVPAREPDARARAPVEAAIRALQEADTAKAIAAYRARLQEDPANGLAARELGLLLASMASRRPLLRPEALSALERALPLNPGDPELLVEVGRLRALGIRAGAVVARAEPVRVDGLSGVADAAGGVSLSFVVRNLEKDSDARSRYRVEVEVSGPEGEAVPVQLRRRGGEEPLEVMVEAQPAIASRLELRLLTLRPGPHTVRLRVLDLLSGAVGEALAPIVVP